MPGKYVNLPKYTRPVYRLTACPACGKELTARMVAPHLWFDHKPDDFGLSPIGEKNV